MSPTMLALDKRIKQRNLLKNILFHLSFISLSLIDNMTSLEYMVVFDYAIVATASDEGP